MEQTTASASPSIASVPQLVRHMRRTRWGHGVVVWERDHKKACFFEDGKCRVFGRNYYDLLEAPPTEDAALGLRLYRQAQSAGMVPDWGQPVNAPRPERIQVTDQIQLFLELYGDGFADARWKHERRRREGGRRIKRLRQPAILDAQRTLARARLENSIASGMPDLVRVRLLEVLEKTDLVPRRELEFLRTGVFGDRMASAWLGQLHSLELDEHSAYANLCVERRRAGQPDLSWQMATAARALIYPHQHILVRAQLFRTQLAAVDERVKLPARYRDSAYVRCVNHVHEVREQLRAADLQPTDLFDVVDFLTVTRAPKHNARLCELMVGRLSRLDA